MTTRYDISFILPMYNESENISDTISRISAFAGRVCRDYEIVVADDASTDGSGDLVEKLALANNRIKLVRLARNTKFGGALRAGIERASREIVLYTDSDLPAREDDMKKALELLEGADIVTAYSLVIKDSSLKRIILSKGYNFLVRSIFGLKLRDINSGLKIYRRRVLEGLTLRSKSPFIDVEIFAEAAKRGARIMQYGLIFELRTRGNSAISRPGVVIRTFWDMLVYRFSAR